MRGANGEGVVTYCRVIPSEVIIGYRGACCVAYGQTGLLGIGKSEHSVRHS